MADGVEKPALVFDCGSSMTRIGWAGDDAPRSVFSSVIGKRRFKEGTAFGTNRNYPFYGDVAQSQRGTLTLRHPIQRGIIIDFEEMETLWHHCMYNELRVQPEEQPILLSEAVYNPKSNRE